MFSQLGLFMFLVKPVAVRVSYMDFTLLIIEENLLCFLLIESTSHKKISVFKILCTNKVFRPVFAGSVGTFYTNYVQYFVLNIF